MKVSYSIGLVYTLSLSLYQYPDLSNKVLPLQWICITFLLELIGSVAYNPHKDFFLSHKNHRCIWGCEYLIILISSSCLIFDLPSRHHGCWASYTGVCMVSRVISQSGVLLFPRVLHHAWHPWLNISANFKSKYISPTVPLIGHSL